jgi:copper(I)-binding protein
MTRLVSVLLSLAVAIGTAACSGPPLGSAAGEPTGAVGEPAAGEPSGSAGDEPAAGFLVVSGAWARAASAGGTTAVYLQVANGQAVDDALVGASTEAGTASLHRTTTDADGMTGMQPTDRIEVPAGQTVLLEPGGYHVMVESLTADLDAGSSLSLVLTFEGSGDLSVIAEVRAN